MNKPKATDRLLTLFSRVEKTSFLIKTLFLSGFLLTAVQARADVVTDWNAIADEAVVTNAGRAPGEALIDMAYVHAAIYDAVNAIDRRYSVYAVAPASVPPGDTSKDAAAATAAFKVLLRLFPMQKSFLLERYEKYIAAIPTGPQKTAGIALGDEIGSRFMDLRANDGRDRAVPFVSWTGLGAWQPTPPAFEPSPVTPWMATLRPFMIKSPSQFRPDGPPELGTAKWANDYKETRAYGALKSVVRTEEQTQIGLFYTEHTGAQYNRIFRQFAEGRGLSTADNARLFAMLYLSVADSLIASWDAKYHYHFWRPVTAIRAGAVDGNEATEAEVEWTPLAVTPGHPEYPAAHGSLTAAYADALQGFFGTRKVRVTLTSTVTNSKRDFEDTDDIIEEIIDARIYGGMHYRTSGVDGTIIGRNVTRWMMKNFFRPVR